MSLRRDLPESYFTLTVAERLKVLAETGRGGANVEWLAPNCWGLAIQDTCREAAEQLALVEPALEASRRLIADMEKVKEKIKVHLFEPARWMPVEQFIPPPYRADCVRMMLQDTRGYVCEGYGRWILTTVKTTSTPVWRWYDSSHRWVRTVEYVRPMPEPFKEA